MEAGCSACPERAGQALMIAGTVDAGHGTAQPVRAQRSPNWQSARDGLPPCPTCVRSRDNLASYTWTEYDPSEGGVQVIKDTRNNVKITTEFLKVAGGDQGGSWAARVKGQPIDPCPNNVAPSEGPYYEEFQERIGKTHYLGLTVPPGDIWKAKASILDQGIPALVASYKQRFQTTFPIPSGYPISNRASLESFSRDITANLIGGVGYFYGTSIVNRGFAHEWDEDDETSSHNFDNGPTITEPKALLTATPSRSFFPRGFYCLEILKDWIGLIDEDGWVAREQILGEEARSKVPVEFQTQVPTYANPPTLTIAVTAFIERLKVQSSGPSSHDLGMDYSAGGSQIPLRTDSPKSGSKYLESPEHAMAFLKSIYKPSRDITTGSDGLSEDRSNNTVVKRAREQKLIDGEGGLRPMTMKQIAGFIGETDDELTFTEIEKAIIGNIEDLHWSEEDKMYCDVGVNDEGK
ncbi:glycoside hydrolase family protein [Salix suchowensis]|nr:glycoside hydrolase family protein [Salix suchowensis]